MKFKKEEIFKTDGVFIPMTAWSFIVTYNEDVADFIDDVLEPYIDDDDDDVVF